MSIGTETAAEIEIDVTRLPGNGRARWRVTIRQGAEVLHLDTIDIESTRSRNAFLNAVVERAEGQGVEFDREQCERILMQHAADAPEGNGNGRGEAAARDLSPYQVLQEFGVEVLGEMDDQSIVCWVPSTGKRWKIKSPSNWKVEEMLQATGQQAIERLWRQPTAPPEGRFTPTELREAVAVTAATAPRLTSSRLVGQGVWKHEDGYLVVNGGDAYLYDGTDFQPVQHPRLGSKIIDFNGEEAWFDDIREATMQMTLEAARAALQRLREILGNWNWSHPVDPEVVAALVPATFVQACWTWRPLVSIIGASDTGKSTLLQQFIVPVLGEWAIAADRSTEAGLRQAIGCNAAPVLIDEFDLYKQRQQVLELFRTSSRGGEILRGTADQTGLRYGVRHIAWFAAIESGDVWGQDRNRFIRLELRPPQERGTLVLPGVSELAGLGRQLTAAALWAAPTAIVLADAIKSTVIPGVHGRLVESFAVPAAMHSVLTHGREVSREVAAETLERMINGRAVLVGQGERDEVRLLRDILSSIVRVSEPSEAGNGSVYAERSISQILGPLARSGGRTTLAASNKAAEETIAAKGVRVVQRKGSNQQRLFIADDVVRRELLQDTRWANSQIDQLLSRLDGAEREQQRLAGTVRSWGLSLPWPGCLVELNGRDNEQDNVNG